MTDRDEAFRERTIRGLSALFMFVAVLLGISNVLAGSAYRLPQPMTMFVLNAFAALAVSKGRLTLGGWLVIATGMIFAEFSHLQVGYWVPGTIAAAIVTLLASTMLLPQRSARYIPYLLIAQYVVMIIWAKATGVNVPVEGNPFANPVVASINFSVIILALGSAQSYLIHEFNAQRQELRNLVDTLEERVLERTRDLQIAANVSQQVTQVLNLDALLPMLAEETRAAFDLYHVSVFLRNEAGDFLRLHAATGDAGSAMVRQNKQFAIDDQGLVPLAAREQRAQVANDVTLSPEHTQNPLLPDTRSEAALPMMFGPALVGVLDLQSEQANTFDADDIKVLTTLAEQIAVAVRNAYLFEQMQAARHEAEKANSVKSQFLASMSHELRTPLNAILNFTQFVSSGMLGPVNDEQIDMLQKVTHSGKHLLGLINDVLDISKIEAGALKLFIENNVDLAREAQAVVAAARTLLNEKPVELQVEIASDLPVLTGDKRRIRQIMLNLISNACKFTEAGNIRVVLEQQDDVIVFAVHDSGPGIAAEDADLVFETFRQTTNGLRQGEGTGLGLPISRRLAEAHGGRLWFESVVGQGSHFYVSLPLHYLELEAPKELRPHVA